MELKAELKTLLNQSTDLVFNDQVIKEMLKEIGNPDPVIRDELICNLFYAGIPTGKMTEAQQMWLLKSIITNRLILTDIEVPESDSVFTRTFSLLVLGLIVSQDQSHFFIEDQDLFSVFDLGIAYLKEEQDTRGYILGKGWAHGMAHGADLLVSIASHPKIRLSDVIGIQEAITSILRRQTEPFNAAEEQRLSTVIIVLLIQQRMTESSVVEWLTKLKAFFDDLDYGVYENYQLKRKYEQFVESLYFQLSLVRESNSRLKALVKELAIAKYS